jgi:hypothetical protein
MRWTYAHCAKSEPDVAADVSVMDIYIYLDR